MAYHHHHHGHVPPNNLYNQYLTKDECGKYSSIRFDEFLAGGKITKQEVEEFLFKLHEKNGRRCLDEMIVIFGCLFTFCCILVLGGMIKLKGGWFFPLFIVAIAGSIYMFVKKRQDYERKLRSYIEQQNQNVFNQRGLHWAVGSNCSYLQLMMNFSTNQAQMQIPIQQQQMLQRCVYPPQAIYGQPVYNNMQYQQQFQPGQQVVYIQPFQQSSQRQVQQPQQQQQSNLQQQQSQQQSFQPQQLQQEQENQDVNYFNDQQQADISQNKLLKQQQEQKKSQNVQEESQIHQAYPIDSQLIGEYEQKQESVQEVENKPLIQ